MCVLVYCLCVSFTQVSAYKYINVPCACVCIMIEDVSRFVACNDSVGCVCRFSLFDINLAFFFFLAVPNGMGVEAGDALLDEGPQSLPAMRL